MVSLTCSTVCLSCCSREQGSAVKLGNDEATEQPGNAHLA